MICQYTSDDFGIMKALLITMDHKRYIQCPRLICPRLSKKRAFRPRINCSATLFYEELSPAVYAVKAQNELSFGKPVLKKDEEDNDITEPSASEYMYYAYPNYQSKGYEAHVIRLFADSLMEYNRSLPEGAEVVILAEFWRRKGKKASETLVFFRRGGLGKRYHLIIVLICHL